MQRILRSRCQLSFPLFASAALCLGCGSDGRNVVTGQVTVNGKTLEDGYIQFRPMKGTASPTAGAKIQAGRYQIAREDGLRSGEFRVEIRAMRETKREIVDPITDEVFFASEQFLPACFNTDSELVTTVDESESPHDFDLEIEPQTGLSEPNQLLVWVSPVTPNRCFFRYCPGGIPSNFLKNLAMCSS